MKKILLGLGLLFFTASISAQVVKKTTNAVKKSAKTVAHKTVEMGSHAKARVSDKQYKGKRASNGKIVYIDSKSRYYWIDDKGHKVYVKQEDLKTVPIKE